MKITNLQCPTCRDFFQVFGRVRRRFCSTKCGNGAERNHNWKGGRHQRSDGSYFLARDSQTGKSRYEHILIAERALGKPLPEGAQVHHVNEDKADNQNSNLVICQDAAYHALLHVRTKVLRLGGNPDTDKVCSHCHTVQPNINFTSARGTFDGKHGWCKTCRRPYDRNRYAAELPQ